MGGRFNTRRLRTTRALPVLRRTGILFASTLNPRRIVMSGIKLHLEAAELAAIQRFADKLNVRPEDVAYAALNRLMMNCRDPEVAADVKETKAWRSENLPLWSDSAGSVHAYEGMPDDEPTPNNRV
jgi:hypothetical protein